MAKRRKKRDINWTIIVIVAIVCLIGVLFLGKMISDTEVGARMRLGPTSPTVYSLLETKIDGNTIYLAGTKTGVRAYVPRGNTMENIDEFSAFRGFSVYDIERYEDVFFLATNNGVIWTNINTKESGRIGDGIKVNSVSVFKIGSTIYAFFGTNQGLYYSQTYDLPNQYFRNAEGILPISDIGTVLELDHIEYNGKDYFVMGTTRGLLGCEMRPRRTCSYWDFVQVAPTSEIELVYSNQARANYLLVGTGYDGLHVFDEDGNYVGTSYPNRLILEAKKINNYLIVSHCKTNGKQCKIEKSQI